MIDYKIVRSLMLHSGQIAMSYYNTNYRVSSKEDSSPVTDADKHVHEHFVKELERFKYPVLSEEGTHSLGFDSSSYWVLDPIDGTKDFIQKTGDFSIMLAFVSLGSVKAGFVYVPVHDCLYWAEEGMGAYLECGKRSQELRVSNNSLDGGRILVSRNHLGEHEKIVSQKYDMKSTPMGSAGYKISQIACGNAELYINSSNRSCIWDVAAADCILREAGGVLGDLEGESIVYDTNDVKLEKGYVATNNKDNLLYYISNAKN